MSDADSEIPSLPSKRVPYVPLGKSGLKVSRIILGCMTYGAPEWAGWLLPEAEAIKHINESPISAGEWSRFEYYAQFIRVLHAGLAESDQIHPTTFFYLHQHARGKPLFPNIRELSWGNVTHDLAPIISPTIRILRIPDSGLCMFEFDNSRESCMQRHAFKTQLPSILRCLPDLQVLQLQRLGHEGFWHPFAPPPEHRFVAKNIRNLYITETYDTLMKGALAVVSTIQGLTDLKIDVALSGQSADMEDLDSWDKTHIRTFKKLRHLQIEAGMAQAAILIDAIVAPNLEDVELARDWESDPCKVPSQLTKALETLGTRNASTVRRHLRDLNISLDPGLRREDIDVPLLSMMEAWPALERLAVSVAILTPDILRAIARGTLPKLESLDAKCLSKDFLEGLPSSDSLLPHSGPRGSDSDALSGPKHGLLQLHLLKCTRAAHPADVAKIARFVVALFPRLDFDRCVGIQCWPFDTSEAEMWDNWHGIMQEVRKLQAERPSDLVNMWTDELLRACQLRLAFQANDSDFSASALSLNDRGARCSSNLNSSRGAIQRASFSGTSVQSGMLQSERYSALATRRWALRSSPSKLLWQTSRSSCCTAYREPVPGMRNVKPADAVLQPERPREWCRRGERVAGPAKERGVSMAGRDRVGVVEGRRVSLPVLSESSCIQKAAASCVNHAHTLVSGMSLPEYVRSASVTSTHCRTDGRHDKACNLKPEGHMYLLTGILRDGTLRSLPVPLELTEDEIKYFEEPCRLRLDSGPVGAATRTIRTDPLDVALRIHSTLLTVVAKDSTKMTADEHRDAHLLSLRLALGSIVAPKRPAYARSLSSTASGTSGTATPASSPSHSHSHPHHPHPPTRRPASSLSSSPSSSAPASPDLPALPLPVPVSVAEPVPVPAPAEAAKAGGAANLKTRVGLVGTLQSKTGAGGGSSNVSEPAARGRLGAGQPVPALAGFMGLKGMGRATVGMFSRPANVPRFGERGLLGAR
ncbi:uncharacterized protein C8Q71DRAFT_723165 [Rhodofomes roseus]|uniref:Uncharacterized protein n=1 Tax=Rhodofomes roseus TaxID=34475 RepID=A0ABQ8KJZ2_9APHY|nr:uncharacterized protein C8Q71DRAFT_723165 [Rhodofomes roseus]KAH9837907.1 hypothetical protein C8Q71DRAFT_723165 [Rhodofomes roseus]